MICKNKIGNLHTSYEKMGDSYHLKAFFGVNLICAMNEVLKFPNLFKIEETSQYLDSVRIAPKTKSFSFKGDESYIFPKYISEDQEIIPKLLNISALDEGIVYFFFDHHFSKFAKKKFKVKIGVIDKTIEKALILREQLIEFNKILSNILNKNDITTEVVGTIIKAAELGESLRAKKNKVFLSVSSNFIENPDLVLTDLKILNQLSDEIKKEIKIINQVLGKDGNKFKGNSLKDNPGVPEINTFNSFEKEFKNEVSFYFKDEFTNSAILPKLPSLPTRTSSKDQILYSLIKPIKIKKIDSIPSFTTTYSKKHLYEHKQTLENKAENYNLSFVNRLEKNSREEVNNFILKTIPETVYVLIGHNENNVTSEIFVPISEFRENLLPTSTYLCKTEMIEAENQYFILET